MILYSKELIDKKKKQLKHTFMDSEGRYLAILYFGTDPVISVYVRNKLRFGQEIGLEVKLFGQEEYYTLEAAYTRIDDLNNDPRCIGIILQLPLPSYLKQHQQWLCNAIVPSKDVDAMTSTMLGFIATDHADAVYPAAVGASIQLLQEYRLDNLRGKQVSILGQSNLVGKPFALHCINQGAQVHSFGVDGNPEIAKEFCKKSDYIISATGVIGLITKEYVRDDQSQIIVDIGYGLKDGKAMGDVVFDEVQDMVHAITPVPGGIGPLCVCQLFENAAFLANKHR